MNRRVLIAAAGLVMVAGLIALLARARSASPADHAKPSPAASTQPAAADRGSPGGAARPQVMDDDDVDGTLRLEGQVVDATDTPVSGAKVTIDTRPPRTATTEADGSFAFDKLLGRPYEVVATSGAEVAGPVIARLTERSEPVVLRLARGAEVQVTVVAASGGAAIASARVELRGLVDRTTTTDPAGAAAFQGVPPGNYKIAVSSSGHARSSTYARVTTATSTHRFELVRGVGVSGRVVGPDDQPVGGAKVAYESVSDWAQASDKTTTDAAGKFTFDALPPGSFRFIARHDVHAPGATDAITLDGVTARSGITIRVRAGASLTGVVVDRARAPVPWARIRVAEDVAGLQIGKTRQTTADAEGRFTIAGLPRTRVNVVGLHDLASSKTATVDLQTVDVPTLELVLDLEGTIAGVVVDSTGEPIEGAQVWAAPDASAGETAPRDEQRLRGRDATLTDAAGTFAFFGLRPGRYAVQANPPGAFDLATSELRDEVPATVGDTQLRIVIPADGSITGKVAHVDGQPPASFAVSLGGWGPAIRVSSRDGSFTLRDLPPHTYHLTIRGPGFAERALPPIAVVSGKATDAGTITVHKGRSISGRVVDASGTPVAGASVLAGAVLWGTGSKAKAPSGFGGPPGADRVKETTTDERGQFTLVGVGRGLRHLVADHEALGRSVPVSVSTTDQSPTGVQLVMVALGSLEGKVTKQGAPASRVVVTAQSKTVGEIMFTVLTGEDGAFRFDRLAPDSYLVSAMLGQDPMRGFGFHSRSITIAADHTAQLDLAIDAGTQTLVVTPVAPGRPVSFALIETVKGVFAPKIYKDLQRQTMGREQGSSTFGMSFGGRPVRVDHLTAGEYTVCAVPYPDEVTAAEGQDYMLREGDNLPVFCKQVAVVARTAEQTVELPVEIPAYVPPTTDEDSGS